jgi:hypothetical protein
MSGQETEKSGGEPAPGDGELHPAPSMWWFAIAMGLIIGYALLMR